jgi:hypothetical protein
MNRSKRASPQFGKSEVIPMYQIYSLLTILVLLGGITIWASIPEEQIDGVDSIGLIDSY